MKPTEVYLGALKYHFSTFVVEYNARSGDVGAEERRKFYSAARKKAAEYAFRHNYANATVSLPIWRV